MPDFDPFSWRSLAQSMRPPRESTRLCRRFRDSRLQARSGCAMIIGKRSIPNSAPRIGGPPIDTSQASRPERQRRAKLIPACCNVVRLASSEASRQSPKCKGRRANVNDETRVLGVRIFTRTAAKSVPSRIARATRCRIDCCVQLASSATPSRRTARGGDASFACRCAAISGFSARSGSECRIKPWMSECAMHSRTSRASIAFRHW